MAAASGHPAQLRSEHLLCWVMHNTVAATEAGLQEWASQGGYFATTKGGNAQYRSLPEVLELKELYSERVGEESVCLVVARTQRRL